LYNFIIIRALTYTKRTRGNLPDQSKLQAY